MAPRVPRPKKPATKADALTAPSKSRGIIFSPYPDLSMAIDMLQRRTKQVKGERLSLVTRWLESLQRMQAEMQKLHKLELLASRLTENN